VFKAHRLLYHSTLGFRVVKKRRRVTKKKKVPLHRCPRDSSVSKNGTPGDPPGSTVEAEWLPGSVGWCWGGGHHCATGWLTRVSWDNLGGVEVQWFRGGLVFKAHRLLYRSTLGLRVTKKKVKQVPLRRCPLDASVSTSLVQRPDCATNTSR